MNEVCPICKGKGEVVVKHTAQEIRQQRLNSRFTYEECERCSGTGIVNI
jgi:hypothetical protein